jgi:hypothetical protein
VALAERDAIVDHLGGPGDDEQAVAIALDLRPLVRLRRILDGELVEAELLLDDAKLGVGRLEQPDPDQMAFAPRPVAALVDADVGNLAAVMIDAGADQACGPARRQRGAFLGQGEASFRDGRVSLVRFSKASSLEHIQVRRRA